MFEELKKYEPIYIIGHKKPDVDSVIASILLNNIFKSKGIESYPCFLDSEYNIDEYNAGVLKDCVSLDEILVKENSDTCNYVLVDHNDPIQSVGFGKRIVWGIDHHKDAKILSNILLSDVYDFSNEEKFMIYMASLTDSLFFKGSRFTEKDRIIIDELGFDFNADDMFKKYFISTDLSVGIDGIFKDVSKSYVYNGFSFFSIVVKTFNENDYLKKDFREKVVNTNNCLGMWIDLDREITYAYFNCNGVLKEFIYDCIASRAATVIPDIFKYLDEKK